MKNINFSVIIQRLFLLGMILFILPFITKTTTYICGDLIVNCIQYEADLESETESETSELTNVDDDFVFPDSAFLLSNGEKALAAFYAIEIKNRITKDDPSPPPEMRSL